MLKLVDLQEAIGIRGNNAMSYLMEHINNLVIPEDPLREAVLHYPQGGGKGFRPAMLQLVCGALGGIEEITIPAAAAIEAVHVSSLIHDDYMDNDETRRGIPAVWKKWTPTIAILAGDVLFGVAFAIAGEIQGISYEMKYKFTRDLSRIYIQLCHGQMLDIDFTETKDFEELSVEDIKEMQYLKTGVLFEFACVTGARLALGKRSDPLIDKIRKYAKLAGTAFQIQDDIIGLIGEAKDIGKPVGSDIKEGKRTLIAVHAVSNANDIQKKTLLSVLGNQNASNDDVQNCLNVMQEIGSIEFATNLALEMANEAIVITQDFPENLNTELLREFAKYMIERNL